MRTDSFRKSSLDASFLLNRTDFQQAMFVDWILCLSYGRTNQAIISTHIEVNGKPPLVLVDGFIFEKKMLKLYCVYYLEYPST